MGHCCAKLIKHYDIFFPSMIIAGFGQNLFRLVLIIQEIQTSKYNVLHSSASDHSSKRSDTT